MAKSILAKSIVQTKIEAAVKAIKKAIPHECSVEYLNSLAKNTARAEENTAIFNKIEENIQLIQKSMALEGWKKDHPAVVSKTHQFRISGDCRTNAAVRQGIKNGWVIYVEEIGDFTLTELKSLALRLNFLDEPRLPAQNADIQKHILELLRMGKKKPEIKSIVIGGSGEFFCSSEKFASLYKIAETEHKTITLKGINNGISLCNWKNEDFERAWKLKTFPNLNSEKILTVSSRYVIWRVMGRAAEEFEAYKKGEKFIFCFVPDNVIQTSHMLEKLKKLNAFNKEKYGLDLLAQCEFHWLPATLTDPEIAELLEIEDREMELELALAA